MTICSGKLTLLAMVLAGVLSGQTEEPLRGTPEERSLRFNLVLAVSGTKELYYADSRGEHRMLPPGRTRGGAKHRYDGPSPIVFYEKIPGPEDTTINRPVAQAEFRQSQSDLLILLHPFDDRWERVRTIVIDDSPEEFPAGSVHVLNISLYPIACLINDSRFTLAPREGETVSVDTNLGLVDWRLAAKMDAEWRIVRASSTQFLAGMRQIIVVNVNVSDPANPGLDIFSLYDRPATAGPANATADRSG